MDINEQLAKWRWPDKNVKVIHGQINVYEQGSIYPIKYRLFTQSVDNCLDILAPKLAANGVVVTVGSLEHSGYYAYAHHFLKQEPELVKAGTPALALSEAIGQVIG